MALRKTTRTRTSAGDAPAAPTARPRRPGAPRRARKAPDAPAAVTIAPPTEEEIRVRAYYLHLERVGRPADPLGDWLRAEQELVAGGAARG